MIQPGNGETRQACGEQLRSKLSIHGAGRLSGWVTRMRDDRGSALIEFAIMMPLIVFIFLAAMDYTLVLQQSMVVVDAATNGTRYAEAMGNATNVAGMVAAAQSTAVGVPGFSATAVSYCTCPPELAGTACATTCASGYSPAVYARVNTAAFIPLLFKVTGIPAGISLSAASSMRVSPGTR